MDNLQSRIQLGHFEEALTLTGQFEPFSVVSVLRMVNGPTPETVRWVLDLLQQEQPLLNVSIQVEGGRFFFEDDADSTSIPLEIQRWENEAHWQEVATEVLNTAVSIQTPPLVRCIYLYQAGDQQPVDLIFVYHHAIMDATSTTHLYDRFLALASGEASADELVIQNRLPSADDLLPKDMRGFKRNGRILRYAMAQMADELQYRRQLGNGRKAPIHTKTTQNRILTRHIDTEATKAIIRRSRKERVSMNSVVSSALLLAVHKHLYGKHPMPLRGLTFANLRPYLTSAVPQAYLGCYIAMLRYTIFCEDSADFWQVVQRFQTTLTQSSKRGEKFPAMLMSKHLMKMLVQFQAFRMGTTAVSYPGPLNLKKRYGTIQLTALHGFISNNRLGPEFTAFAKILFGQLSWDFLYLEADMDKNLANIIADEVVQILTVNA